MRRHLATLGLSDLGLVDQRQLDHADDAVLQARLDGGAVLMDSTGAAHIARIGRLLWSRALQRTLLTLGASGVAQALILHWQTLGLAPVRALHAPVTAADGPVFLLVGSQSSVTAVQADAACGAFDTLVLDMPALVASDAALAAGRRAMRRTLARWPPVCRCCTCSRTSLACRAWS